MIKGMQEGIFVCTLQNLSILDIGDIVGTTVKIRGDMSGKQDGAFAIFYNAGKEMQNLIP